MINRKTFLSLSTFALSFGLTGLLSGCGGGGRGNDNREVTINDTGGTGNIADASYDPFPGTTFIATSRQFSFGWSNAPSQFTVSLNRYKEPRGGESRSIEKQKINVDRTGTNLWSVRRRDGFDLDTSGVYYLELNQPGRDVERTCYIVGANRSVSAVTRDENTGDIGTNGRLSDVQISPFPGSTFIGKSTDFELRWADGTTPPQSFGVQLRRYQEARGDAGQSDSEQRIELDRQGDSYVWQVRRRDNFDLDRNGVYYLELNGGGEQVRAAYIVESS